VGTVELAEGQTVRLKVEEVGTALERPTVREALRQAGLVTTLSPHLEAKILPGVAFDAVRQSLARAGGKPLSELITEQRGPAP
jgi:hypothetical protein